MRRYFFVGVVCLLFLNNMCGFAEDTKRVENPAKPKSPGSGYNLKLEKSFQIKDPGTDDFFFKYILDMRIASDGSIFVLDKKQVLKFKPDGTFVKNFYKHGQGPAEATYVSAFRVAGNRLVIHDSRQRKVLIFDHTSGKLESEFKLHSTGSYRLIAAHEDSLYFTYIEIADTRGKLKITEIDKRIVSTDYSGKNLKELANFPTPYVVIKTGDNYFSDSRARFLSAESPNDRLFISHTPVYGIKLYDPAANAVTHQFSRKYPRVKTTKDIKKYASGGNIGKLSLDGKQTYEIPVAGYLEDIPMLLVVKNKLWVFTSTVTKEDDKNKILVDVFDMDGKYADCFYIVCPEYVLPYRPQYWIKAAHGEYLFMADQDGSGQRYIQKYKIVSN